MGVLERLKGALTPDQQAEFDPPEEYKSKKEALRPYEVPEPKPAYECKCGATIYNLEDDELLTCHQCDRVYPERNLPDIVFARCPWCNEKIYPDDFQLKKVTVSRQPRREHLYFEKASCPNCKYWRHEETY